MEKTVVALFDNLEAAQDAVQNLIDSGFSRDDISVVRTNQHGEYTSGNTVEGSDHDASGAAAGAGIGAVLGGLAGLLVGLGALAIPGIGPIIAAGPIATTLAGAGLGAATGGLVGALANAGVPETDAGAYAEGVRRGGTLVTVRAGEDRVALASEVLNRFTPVDINQRAGEWRAAGWTGYDANSGPYSTSSGAPHTHQAAEMSDSSSGTDEARGADYRTSTGLMGENSGGTYEGTGSAGYTGSGTVYEGAGSYTSNVDRPNTSDISESPDRVGSSTWEDEDTVMRSGHGEMSTSQGFSGQGGGTYERMQEQDSRVHPRSSEGDYQARRDFLNEADPVEGDLSSRDMIQTGRGTYSNEGQGAESAQGSAMEGQLGGHQGSLAGGESFTGRASGDDMGTTGMTFGTGPSRRFEDHDRGFRSHWESNYRSSGNEIEYGYERYQPAYQYGWQLGEQYRDREWNDFEATARTDWERRHPNEAWQDIRAAVHHAWERFRASAEDVASDVTGASYEGAQSSRDYLAGQGYDRTVGDMSRGFDTYDRDFRSDWERSYGATGFSYERYQPAYQYGYNLATDAKYRSHQWGDIESDARRDWEMRHPNDAWDDFRDAVRHAWDRVRSGAHDALD